MASCANRPCLQCRAIDPLAVYHSNTSPVDLKWFDQYPDFLALQISADDGCAFCGLLRHALLYVYNDAAIAATENLYAESVRATWPTTMWNGRVIIYGGRFGTETDDPRSDRNALKLEGARAITNVFFAIWPYPPRRQHEKLDRRNSQTLYFNVYMHAESKSMT